MTPERSRLALGTVQFGQAYGVANETGQVSHDEVADILEYAWATGMDTLDTAVAYGMSEQRLGEIGISHWRVISKLPALPQACADVAGWVQATTLDSLKRLRVDHLCGLLLHSPQHLLGPQGAALYEALAGLRDQGLVEKIGVSVYDPGELSALWPHFQLDLVQVPLNVIDRRVATSGWLSKLHQAGTEVHVRSIFLQGLLLMAPATRPAVFNRWLALWRDWDRWLSEHALTPLRACLGFAMSHPEIDRFVVGVDSLSQLQEIIAHDPAPTVTPPAELSSEELDLINPSRWNTH